jgi:hypothetical protein
MKIYLQTRKAKKKKNLVLRGLSNYLLLYDRDGNLDAHSEVTLYFHNG